MFKNNCENISKALQMQPASSFSVARRSEQWEWVSLSLQSLLELTSSPVLGQKHRYLMICVS